VTMEKTGLSPFLTKINSNVQERTKKKTFPVVGQNFLPVTGGKTFGSKQKVGEDKRGTVEVFHSCFEKCVTSLFLIC